VLEAATIGCVEAMGTMIEDAIRSLNAASRSVWAASSLELSARRLPTVLPVSAINGQIPVVREGIHRELAQYGLTALESTRLETLMALRVTPYACEPAALQPTLRALMEAGTRTEAAIAAKQLVTAAECGHREFLTKALVAACENASLEAGFPHLETTGGLDGATRVIGTDNDGRALITEVRTDEHAELLVETEVVGVTDGSCVSIMDRFDRALEKGGVRTQSPVRKATSGVCELAAAKEFLKKMQPQETTRKNSSQRTQKLNQSHRIRIR
jgi:hypothetical protein